MRATSLLLCCAQQHRAAAEGAGLLPAAPQWGCPTPRCCCAVLGSRGLTARAAAGGVGLLPDALVEVGRRVGAGAALQLGVRLLADQVEACTSPSLRRLQPAEVVLGGSGPAKKGLRDERSALDGPTSVGLQQGVRSLAIRRDGCTGAIPRALSTAFQAQPEPPA